MMTEKTLRRFRVRPGAHLDLSGHKTDWRGTKDMRRLGKAALKRRARAILRKNLRRLTEAQSLLYADDTYAVLIVLQAMDAAGKDGTIKHVMSGVNPQGCQVVPFKRPSAEELDHTFLWRQMKVVPRRGNICIFNRSHYEDVLIVRVHPELLEHSQLPPGKRGKSFWEDRYADINAFEQHLARNGTVIIKFFLHVSKEEQRRRLLARLDDPRKHWKFEPADVDERAYWEQYMEAYEEALRATSTEWAPWYVIPADHKWVARALVADIVTSTITSLDLKYPTVPDDRRDALAAARRKLEED